VRVAYVDLEAYMRLLENWYDIQWFPYHSYIHCNQYVLLTSWKVLKIGQLCHFVQVCLFVCVCEQHLGLLTAAWKFPSTFSNNFPHVFYKFSLQS
jgi:hypothetical protein